MTPKVGSVIQGLKGVLNELNVDYSSIILFGSRAREEASEESDWDFLIILKNTFTSEELHSLQYTIYRRFHARFPFTTIDLLVKDQQTFEKEKFIANTISNEASLEGIKV